MEGFEHRTFMKCAGTSGAGIALGATLGTASVGNTISFLSAPADTIFHNGKVLTVDKSFSIAQAVAIKDGIIAAVGTNDEISKWWGQETVEIDLQGKTVTPGLIDGHPHMAVG